MTSTALATKKLRQVSSVKELLFNDEARAQLTAVAAKHMNPERLMRVVANAIRTTPKLQECEPMSFLGALMTCASLGLEPNTVLGHAYLVPFKNTKKGIVEVQVIVGYKGFADLSRRSGQITSLHADVVYSDDELWSYEYGSNMHLRHKPGPREGKKVAAYCHVALPDGQAFVVLPWSQVLKTRDKSQGWKTAVRYGKTADSPWTTSEDRMGAKTAVRALANAGEMPLSVEFQDAMTVDDQKQDFAAFAMDPTAGVTIEGEVAEPENADDNGETVDPETGEVTDEPDPNAGKGDETPQPKDDKPKGRSVPAKKKPAPPAKTTPVRDEEIPFGGDDKPETADFVRSLVLRVVDDLRSADEGGEIDATLELFKDQLDLLKETAPEAYDEIIEAEQQARERVAAKNDEPAEGEG